MDQQRISRIERSYRKLAPRGEELVHRFYVKLFEDHSEIRSLFTNDMQPQEKKLLASLTFAVKNLRTPENLEQPLKDLGARHAGFGAQAEHYPIVRDTLVTVMSEMAGPAWNEQLQDDWKTTLDLVASTMLQGARDAHAIAACA